MHFRGSKQHLQDLGRIVMQPGWLHTGYWTVLMDLLHIFCIMQRIDYWLVVPPLTLWDRVQHHTAEQISPGNIIMRHLSRLSVVCISMNPSFSAGKEKFLPPTGLCGVPPPHNTHTYLACCCRWFVSLECLIRSLEQCTVSMLRTPQVRSNLEPRTQ